MAFQLGLGCVSAGYGPEHKICGCCTITSTFIDACSSLVTWRTTGNSPTLQVASGSPYAVANSGSEVIGSRGPFTLRTTNGPSCTATATNSCCGRATRVRIVLNGERTSSCSRTFTFQPRTCPIPGLPPRVTSAGTLTATGPVGTIDLEFPLTAQCSTNIPIGYTLELGTFTTTYSSSGGCEIFPRGSGGTVTWSGSNFTSAKLRLVFGFPPTGPLDEVNNCGISIFPQWFFQHYDKVNEITGTSPHTIFPWGSCTQPGEGPLSVQFFGGGAVACGHPIDQAYIASQGIGPADRIFTSCLDREVATRTITCIPC
jgi:hypothetical protein